MKLCEVNDEYCSNGGKVRCKGLCSKHYNRNLTHGDPRHLKTNTRPRKALPGEGWCSSCSVFKSNIEFSKSMDTANGLASVCKLCVSLRWKAQYDPVREKFRSIKKKYGLTESEYRSMLTAQNGLCAICKRKKNLCVDHDHSTGKVRGLLCFGCNSSLGRVEDSVGILQSMIQYLEESYV